jgi:hypothetical protein
MTRRPCRDLYERWRLRVASLSTNDQRAPPKPLSKASGNRVTNASYTAGHDQEDRKIFNHGPHQAKNDRQNRPSLDSVRTLHRTHRLVSTSLRSAYFASPCSEFMGTNPLQYSRIERLSKERNRPARQLAGHSLPPSLAPPPSSHYTHRRPAGLARGKPKKALRAMGSALAGLGRALFGFRVARSEGRRSGIRPVRHAGSQDRGRQPPGRQND